MKCFMLVVLARGFSLGITSAVPKAPTSVGLRACANGSLLDESKKPFQRSGEMCWE